MVSPPGNADGNGTQVVRFFRSTERPAPWGRL